ncbi:MAG: hypothetical protein LRY43_03755 [Gammaproteobacteria bacterium]|nr:hypothetical protein [Gammaproteobacteria bacterium]
MDDFVAQNNETALQPNYDLSKLSAWYNDNTSDSALQSGLFCDLGHQELSLRMILSNARQQH